jgi:DNA-binding CsgD family transcriptional regulator
LFSVTSDLSEREWEQEKLEYMRDFQLLAVHLHDKVLELEGEPVLRAKLTPRELECLQWISDGKTAWECSVILGLSEHTVRCYLESCRYKLNASSNTHAVSIAYQTGLFSQIV